MRKNSAAQQKSRRAALPVTKDCTGKLLPRPRALRLAFTRESTVTRNLFRPLASTERRGVWFAVGVSLAKALLESKHVDMRSGGRLQSALSFQV